MVLYFIERAWPADCLNGAGLDLAKWSHLRTELACKSTLDSRISERNERSQVAKVAGGLQGADGRRLQTVILTHRIEICRLTPGCAASTTQKALLGAPEASLVRAEEANMTTKAITMLSQDDHAGSVRAETLGLGGEIGAHDEIVLVAHGPTVRFTPTDQAACDSRFSSTPARSGSFAVSPGRPLTLTALTALPGGFQELFSGDDAILRAEAIHQAPVRNANGTHTDSSPCPEEHTDPSRPEEHTDPSPCPEEHTDPR